MVKTYGEMKSEILMAKEAARAADTNRTAVLTLDPSAWVEYSRDDEWYEINGFKGCLGIGRTESAAWASANKA